MKYFKCKKNLLESAVSNGDVGFQKSWSNDDGSWDSWDSMDWITFNLRRVAVKPIKVDETHVWGIAVEVAGESRLDEIESLCDFVALESEVLNDLPSDWSFLHNNSNEMLPDGRPVWAVRLIMAGYE